MGRNITSLMGTLPYIVDLELANWSLLINRKMIYSYIKPCHVLSLAYNVVNGVDREQYGKSLGQAYYFGTSLKYK